MQNKPNLPSPHLDPDEDAKKAGKGSKPDPFAPPYNQNLYIGEVIDEEEDAEYVVLVRHFYLLSGVLKLCDGDVMG